MTLRGFTLVEMLVVVGIIAVVLGMIVAVPSRTARRAEVEAAAQELAAVIRKTRNQAVTRQSILGITFNIQNEPGSSGRTLNNRSGGHWYQVLGTSRTSQHREMPCFTEPKNYVFDQYHNGSSTGANKTMAIRPWLEDVRRCMTGERFVLPKRKVRFLALADQDNGNVAFEENFPARWPWSYPRPWFGFYDAGSKRLFPWGGYDTGFKDFRQIGSAYPRFSGSDWDSPLPTGRECNTTSSTISYSGFYYEGGDGPIVGSRHTSDRLVLDDTNGDLAHTKADESGFKADGTTRYTLWRAGEARPLINAAWLDAVLVFLPDGTVAFQPFLLMRHRLSCVGDSEPLVNKTGTAWAHWQGGVKLANLQDIGFADLCSMEAVSKISGSKGWFEASHYDARTGGFFITLAADVPDDNDVFPNAEAALQTLFPCFRVFVTHSGECRVIEVKPREPAGTTWLSFTTDPATGDTGPGNTWGGSFYYNNQQGSNPISEISTNATVRNSSYWSSSGWAQKTWRWYGNDGLRAGNGARLGKPATSFVTADMLANQKWWMKE